MTTEANTVITLIDDAARVLQEAGVCFGHGTTNAEDEAAWLVLWRLGLPLDTPLDGENSKANSPVAPADAARVAMLVAAGPAARHRAGGAAIGS